MLKTFFASFIRLIPAIIMVASFLLAPTQSYAQAITVPWAADETGESCAYTTTSNRTGEEINVATIKGAQCVIANILSIAITVIGFVGFVMFLVASFRYLLSGGNTKATEDSKNTFTFAVVGLVVALSAIIILRIIAAFTGVESILEFQIPDSSWGLTPWATSRYNSLLCVDFCSSQQSSWLV